jgi:diguanylate cyclase (GGDEF)-like protein
VGRTSYIGIYLILLFAEIALPQVPPDWRFWDSADGMAEAYTSGIVGTSEGVWLKHGHVAMNVLDGYRLIVKANPQAIGQFSGTSDGTLWLWSGEALQRYSASSWKSYPVPEVTRAGVLRLDTQQNWRVGAKQGARLSSKLGLAALSRDQVLILLPDSVLEFSASTGRATRILESRQTKLGYFVDIRRGKSDGIWITGHAGLGILSRAKDGGWTWSPHPQTPTEFSDLKDLVESDRGDLLVAGSGRRGNALLRFSEGAWETVYTSHAAVVRGWPGLDGSVWVQDGNQILELAGRKTYPAERVNALTGIVLSSHFEGDGRFYIGTSQGVARYIPPLWRTPAGIRQIDEVVNAITEDRQGRLWFAAASTLISLQGQRWQTFPLPRGHQAWTIFTESLVALPDGRIAVRTTAPNLLLFNPTTQTFTTVRHPEGRDTRVFVAHPEGLLVETCPPGDRSNFRLEIYDGRSFRTLLDHGSVVGSDDVRTLHLDATGSIWAGCLLGLGRYRGGRFERQGKAEGFSDAGCFHLYETPSGTLYAGGREFLFVRKRDSWQMIRGGFDRVRSMVSSRDGTLWVASGSGIQRYRNGVWLSNGVEEGLPSNVAYRLFEDSRGRIWAGTTRGISLYHPDADVEPPTTFISDEHNSHEALAGGQVHLVFSGMDRWKQTPSNRLLFSWRLDNGPWTPFSTDTFAAVKHLSTGRRRFEVRAMDRNGNIDPHPAGFELSVQPPWYGNPTFQVVAGAAFMCFATLLLLAIMSYRQRGRLIAELHRKKRLETDRQVILEMIARRRPLTSIFQKIARSIAVNCPGTLAGVIRISGSSLDVAGADSPFPEGFKQGLLSLSFDGTAFDPLWSRLHAIASQHHLNDCHLAPVRAGDDELLGGIAAFVRPTSRTPASRSGRNRAIDVGIVTAMSNLAGAAIENARLYEKLAYQAGHDDLTGLPNRLTFESRLREALHEARGCGRFLAVFFLDLDRFKQINDSLGHRVGDLFLQHVARRLSDAIPEGSMLARIGGDEFTLLLWQQPGQNWAEETASQMLEALHVPCLIEGHELAASASIGISVYPQDGADPAALQKHADAAMYRAKLGGKNRYEFFTADMVFSTAIALEMEQVLRSALDQGRFELYYQPQFTMDGDLAGVEALPRLRHPDLSLISPEHFLRVAEETGLILSIGEWALREACSQMRRWRKHGLRVPKVSVNVSPVQLGWHSRSPAFVETVAHVLKSSALEPGLLELELTEASIMSNLGRSTGQIQKLKSLGVRVAVDHFGTGKSLTGLHRLPISAIDVLNIDGSFTNGLDGEVSTLPLVQAILTLAGNLSLTVAATGIERPGQFSALRGIHSGTVQGDLLARPQCAEEIEKTVRAGLIPWYESALELV